MATSSRPRRWIALLAAIAAVAAAGIMIGRRMRGGDAVPSHAAPASSAVLPTTKPPPTAHVAPGDEIFAVDLGIVTGIDFEKGGHSINVRRKLPDSPLPGALLLDGPALYETSIPREVFDRLSAGCETLGR